jgi:hypothetical protein
MSVLKNDDGDEPFGIIEFHVQQGDWILGDSLTASKGEYL